MANDSLSYNDNTHTASVSASQYINIKAVNNATSNSAPVTSVTWEMDS